METLKNKLLLVSWTIPPSPGGSAFISHQLAKNFQPQEIIIAGGCTKPFNRSQEYDGVLYHYFFTELNWRGHGDRYFILFRMLLFPFFLLNLTRLIQKEKPNTILATFPDGYYLLASWMVARIFKLKFFSYFHNTYPENRHGLNRWIAHKIQNVVFKQSNFIFTMSDGLCDHYKNNYPQFISKFLVLPHTFNNYPTPESDPYRKNSHAPFKLVLIGTFNNSNIESTLRLLNIISKLKDLYLVDLYTPTNKQILKYKWNLDTEGLGVRHCGFVKQEEVNEVLAGYDGCILTHGFTGGYTDTEYQTIFPTRMIPLLLSGKPIFAHCPEKSFLSRFIKNYDCAEIVSTTDESTILSGLKRVTTDPERISHLIENAKKAAAYFYGPRVVQTLKDKIFSD